MTMIPDLRPAAILSALLILVGDGAQAADTAPPSTTAVPPSETAAERGYRILRTRPFLPPDFDQRTFDVLWTVWPEPLRSKAKAATPTERRRMAFSRYGLIEPPDDGFSKRTAIGWIDVERGGWVMNCLACHAGKVAGKVIPGLPNTHFALQTLIEDVRVIKPLQFKTPSHLETASLTLPLGTTNGTSNSVVFGIVLGTLRDRDMNVNLRPLPKLLHHDMDAPPFWNVSRKSSLYCDGHAPKTHRMLMQFMLIPRNNAKVVASWEDDFRDILAWIESVEPPKYPWTIDAELAEQGRGLFVENCSRCHGTYGERGKYEQKTIPLDVIGTDPLRLQALTPKHRRWLKEGWMSRYGKDPVILDPKGYVAPPLNGIWASAPYFHNGSVPTLWHVLHPETRPAGWKRTEEGYDQKRIGLEVTEFEKIPADITLGSERRTYFDTRPPGKSAAGHLFPNALNEAEKRAVLEYLKSL
jgi:mono/diheme cytochrome c family protein